MGSGASKGVESSNNQEEQAFYAERPVRVSIEDDNDASVQRSGARAVNQHG